MSSSNTTYLITGANRGIGKGLLEAYLARSSTTVVACVRDPNSATSKTLSSLPKGTNSSLVIVKVDSASETDAATAVKELKSTHDISHLDIVIANAGISEIPSYVPAAEVKIADMQKHVAVNAMGPLVLFQAVYPLMKKAKQPKFVVVGSPMGSIGGMELRPFPCAAYGGSKAMVHYLVRKIHFENQGMVAFTIDPGFVQTELGNAGARFFGMKEAYITLEESVDGLVKTIDDSTKEKTSGRFAGYNGEEFAW